jgi:ribosomal protein S18 acetylase RimI-like enzyme
MMEVIKYQEDYFEPLFSYWKILGEKIPYFFSVSPGKWRECLLEDKLGNEKLFLYQEIFVAKEKDQILGFIQFGQPAFTWDKDGQIIHNPHMGVIRHFYFDEGRLDVVNLIFASSNSYMKQFPSQHAFFHIFGMSCNAHHGKLHQSLAHVHNFLLEKGYQIEHENVFYTLELNGGVPLAQDRLRLVSRPTIDSGNQLIEICLQKDPIGTIKIDSLEEVTGGSTKDIVYMSLIEINKPFRRQGWGTRAMQLLTANLRDKNYHQIHLDTASTNYAAQQFYERFGFQNRGITRSYIKEQ